MDETLPLRFKTEEVELDGKSNPGYRTSQSKLRAGALCGSSYINERFEDILIKRLSEEHYLRRNGEDMSRVIDRLVIDFERRDKRALDNMFSDKIRTYHIVVEGLRENRKKHFLPDRMRLSR